MTQYKCWLTREGLTWPPRPEMPGHIQEIFWGAGMQYGTFPENLPEPYERNIQFSKKAQKTPELPFRHNREAFWGLGWLFANTQHLRMPTRSFLKALLFFLGGQTSPQIWLFMEIGTSGGSREWISKDLEGPLYLVPACAIAKLQLCFGFPTWTFPHTQGKKPNPSHSKGDSFNGDSSQVMRAAEENEG